MPVIKALLSHEEMLHRLTRKPIIINDLRNDTEEDRSIFNSILTSNFTGSSLSLVPSCECGALKTEQYLGVVCHICNHVVKSTLDQDMEPLVWFRRPGLNSNHAPVEKLISPQVLILLKNRFRRINGFMIINYLLDTTYKPVGKYPPLVNKLTDAGIERGYNNFVRNFDEIMKFLFRLKEYQPSKKKAKDQLEELLELNRDKIFSDYIPLPNKSLLIVERTNVGIYIDPIIGKAIDVVKMLVSIDKSFHDQTTKGKENRTAKALLGLAEFYQTTYSMMSSKPGHLRRHIYGTRTHFSFRAVISSDTDNPVYDEITAPWVVGLTTFRPHLINKLHKLGWTLNDSIGLLNDHIESYHPLVDKLLKELIDESPGRQISVMLQRNPTMLQGSAQLVKLKAFKTNPKDKTISMSDLIIKAPNGDYDGDEFNVSVALDRLMADFWYPFHPIFNVWALDSPYAVSPNVAISKPIIASISQWLKTPWDINESY